MQKNLKELKPSVYGGSEIRTQIKALENDAVVVGTPGRMLDLIRRQITREYTDLST